jgi:hypothetical protein
MSSKDGGYVMVFVSPDSDETTQLPLPPRPPEPKTILWLVFKAIQFLAWAAA